MKDMCGINYYAPSGLGIIITCNGGLLPPHKDVTPSGLNKESP